MTGSMTGRLLSNRYRITERIGLGGMAEVYRAQDSVLGRSVAVKVMLPQYANDPTFTARFRQEAAAAANLQSPYIVNVYDWGQDGETNFMVMEFVRGTDLKNAINRHMSLSHFANSFLYTVQLNLFHHHIYFSYMSKQETETTIRVKFLTRCPVYEKIINEHFCSYPYKVPPEPKS